MANRAKSVLIAEDEKPLAHALELKLKKAGHSVRLAHNGQQALELLREESFDVMLLDLVMPVMDGFQVLEQVNAMERKPQVFVLSNLTQPEDVDRAKSLGAYKFFIKSDTPLNDILDEIGKL